METALYFPLIRVPETSWFTQILLYWDGAASIVPRSLYDDRREFGGYMSELVTEGLVRPLAPEGTMWANSRDFDSRFLALLATQEPSNSFSFGQGTRLHVEKAPRELFEVLADRGLARPVDSRWWEIEKRTANLYMAYLVGSMCREGHSLFPVTDKTNYLANLGTPVAGEMESRLQKLRYVAITQALPIPSRPLPPAELKSFKDHYGDQLSRLRRYLNDQLVDLAVIDDEFLRDVKTESVLQEIRDDVAVLTEQMSRRRWPRLVLVGVGGVFASALAVGATIVTGGAALAVGLGIGAGIASIGPAGYQAVDLLRSPRFDERSPLAYAALAQAL